MSGHSKWSTIKHKKAATDARRGKMFSKILKEITVAARLGGADPKGNPRLRTALLEAKSNSVPGDNIDRAIKKGTGELESAVYEEITYEGYGPGGVAVLVEAATDNRNRTTAEIRHAFARNGGNLGEAGCVAWMFNRRGYFAIDRGAMDEEKFMDLAWSWAPTTSPSRRTSTRSTPRWRTSSPSRRSSSAGGSRWPPASWP